jgi:Uncharacterized conserved protein (DUF2304)
VTPLRVSIAGVVGSLLLLLIVLELIRGRRLKERYALLWLATGVVLLVLSAWRDALNTLAGWLGVTSYPPAVLFAVATLFILLVLLHYSTAISRLTDENLELTQRVALLEERAGRLAPSERVDGLSAKTSPCVNRRSSSSPDAIAAPSSGDGSTDTVSPVVASGVVRR